MRFVAHRHASVVSSSSSTSTPTAPGASIATSNSSTRSAKRYASNVIAVPAVSVSVAFAFAFAFARALAAAASSSRNIPRDASEPSMTNARARIAAAVALSSARSRASRVVALQRVAVAPSSSSFAVAPSSRAPVARAPRDSAPRTDARVDARVDSRAIARIPRAVAPSRRRMAKTSAERGDGTRRATTRAMKRARGDDDGRNALRRAVGSGARDRATAIAHRKFSCGETLFRRYYDAQGVTRDAVDAAALREALATPLPATYRVHGAREGDAAKRALVKALEALRDGGDVEETHGVYEAANPTGTHRRGRPVVPEHVGDVFAFGTSRGLGSRQEVVSTLPVRALGATSGARCLDVCAAPGQKTMQLLECARYGASGGEGVVHANDAHPGRVGTLLDAIDRHARAGCERAGLFVTRSFGQDLHFPLFVSGGDLKRALKNIGGMDDDEKRRAALLAIGGYTHVLADVPCSGDGTIRKDADALVRWHPGIGNALHSTQLAVARRCAQLLKPGGSMVYSTCTFNPIEDEAVVQTLLMDQDLSLELEELDLPLKGRPGMYSWKVGEHINASSEDEDVSIQWFASFDDAVRKSSSEFVKTMWPLDAPAHAEALRLELCARFLPHDDNTGGFFVAKLKRKNDERTRRAFAALVESELVARCDASAAAGKTAAETFDGGQRRRARSTRSGASCVQISREDTSRTLLRCKSVLFHRSLRVGEFTWGASRRARFWIERAPKASDSREAASRSSNPPTATFGTTTLSRRGKTRQKT